ncbi:MAG: hypothetical protein HYX91_03160 [Chloroflexi bacterium]|nr:hypothetical protein [Chloroflexota bacterium]
MVEPFHGNLASREDVLASETETFSYDFLDRLTSVTGPYSESYLYDSIGNIVSKGGKSYTYGIKPHAVIGVGTDRLFTGRAGSTEVS